MVTREQLLAIGLGAGAIDYRLRKEWLHAIHRGVYAVGHGALGPRSCEMAAILACGPTAVLSHRSAAYFWELLPYPASSADVSITVAARSADARPGIRVHRVRSLARRDFMVRDDIPVTAPPRTILDLAAELSVDELERALAEAHVRRLVSERQIVRQLERNPGRPGTRALRALIELEGGSAAARSEAERRMLRLVRAAELPVPEMNVQLGSYEVDLLWREQRLVVEVDGFRFHSSRSHFEGDRIRDSELAAWGFTVIRVTWRQVTGAPEAVVARIAAALARRG